MNLHQALYQPKILPSVRWPAWLRIGFLMLGIQSASAQTGVDPAACWATSAPTTFTMAQACRAHPGCAIALANASSCPAAKVWLDRLIPIHAEQGRITNSAVITAVTPVLRPIPGLVQKVDAVRRQVEISHASASGTGVMLRSRTGASMYYEGALSNGLPEGIGAMIASNGAMTRGDYIGGRLFGNGQALHSRGAVFVGFMQDGHLKGEGAVQLPDGLVMVGYFDNYQADNLTETFYPDGRSQKAFFSEPGKVFAAGPMAAPGQAAVDPDMNVVMATVKLSLDCMSKTPFATDPQETVRVLREVVKGPCGADPRTLKDLAEAEKEAGIAASQERLRAAEQAAATAQANAERNAMFSNFLGQVSSILGSYQVGQQMAAAEAAADAAAVRAPAQVPATSGGGRSSAAPSGGGGQGPGAQRPVGMVAVSAVPGCAVYTLLPREFGRAYFQIHNPCPHGIVIHVKIEVNGQWTTYADMARGIDAVSTAKSNGGISSRDTFQPTILAVCPSREYLERQFGARLTGVYTRNGGQFGCWTQYENTGVGRSN